MFKKLLKFLALSAVLAISQNAGASEENAFQRAMSQGKGGNAFAAAAQCSTSGATSTCTSPYGGTVTQDYSQWTGSSGTAKWSYNNFTIAAGGATMVVNGAFTYQGSAQANGILDGTLTGDLVYDITTSAMTYNGYTIPPQTQHAPVHLTAVFQPNGMASITLSINGGAGTTATWSQTQLMSYLY